MILRKEKLIMVGSSLILLIAIIISVLIFNFSSSKVEKTSAYVNNTLPHIIIDPGHGGEDGGAVADDGTMEKDINLDISITLKELFSAAGYNVTMTRDGDYSIYDDTADTIKSKKTSDMKKRLEIYNSSENNIIISVHQNKFTESKYSGTQVFYSPNNKESVLLAESIRNSVVGMLQPNNTRETKSGNKSIYLLWNSKPPAVIVECGFISNNKELELLKTEEYRKKMAFSIFCGFLDFENNNNGSENNNGV